MRNTILARRYAKALFSLGKQENKIEEYEKNQAEQQPPVSAGPVVLTAVGDGWLRIYDQTGERLLEKTLKEGESFTVPPEANNPMILTGRPDAISVTVGGKPVPPERYAAMSCATTTSSFTPRPAARRAAGAASPGPADRAGRHAPPRRGARRPRPRHEAAGGGPSVRGRRLSTSPAGPTGSVATAARRRRPSASRGARSPRSGASSAPCASPR